MAITFVGSDVGGGNVATIAAGDLVWPTVQADDVALLFWTMSTTVTPTTPTDFTLVTNNDGGAGSLRTYIYRKVCTGSEDGTDVGCTVSLATRQSACIVVWRGVNTTTPVDGTPSFDGTHTTGTTHDNPAYTPSVSGCAIVTSIHERATNVDTAWTPPTDYTERADTLTEATGSGGTITAVADDGLLVSNPSGTPVTPGVWTGNHGTGTPNIGTYTLALRPSGTDATVTPATVAVVAAAPTPTLSAGSTVEPAAVAAVAAVPTPTIPVPDATVTPATVAAVAAVPGPTTSAGSTVTPAAVAAVAAVPTPTLAAGSTVTPAAVAAIAAVPTPTVSAGSTVAPATVASVAGVPTPTLSAGSTVTPAAVAAVATVPTPTVSAGGNITVAPDAVAATVSVPTPTPSAGTTATPATVAAIAAVPLPAVLLSTMVQPAAVAALVSVPTPTLDTGAADPGVFSSPTHAAPSHASSNTSARAATTSRAGGFG